MGRIKSALQINTLLLQTCTHPAQGWARPGLHPRQCFRGSRASTGEELTPPGPSWLLALVQPGRSRQSSGLNILGSKAGISCLSRGELYLYADASRTPAIRNFIGSSDLGLATSCQSQSPPGPALRLGQPCSAHSSRNEHYLISRQRAVKAGAPPPAGHIYLILFGKSVWGGI